MIRPNEYVPEIVAAEGLIVYAKVILELNRCAICKDIMVDQREARWTPFCRGHWTGLEEQMKRARWVLQSGVVDKNDAPICVNCCKEERATIMCALCGQERPSSQANESFGDPPEYLCQLCYETVPAATWHAKTEALREDHRWDFE